MAVPLAASMLLAGCGGDGKPDATSSIPSISTSPSITATLPTATNTTAPKIDPDIPAAAKAHTPAGAEAFVRYFIEQENVAWTQPRVGNLPPLCQASAVACAELEKEAARLTKQGHRYDGDPLTITFIGALDSPGPKKLDVLARVVQERRSEIDATGKVYITDKRQNLRLDFELLYTGKTWSVSSLNLTN